MLPWVRAAACAGAIAMPSACSGPGSYVWYTTLPAEPSTLEYAVNGGDVLSVRVLGHDDMSTPRVKVRADGRIALPIIGEVDARGKTPAALRTEIEGRLKEYVVMPSVTVNVEETQPATISVLGEVTHPGVFPLEPNMRLAQAIALGGGLTDFACRDCVFVVRTVPQPMRIRFTYRSVLRDEASAGAFRLHPGDLIEVE
jgi:polysaccharide export outer membrane protein